MSPEEGYERVDRNIHQRKGGKFRVMLTRRDVGCIYGGTFTDLAKAKKVRNKLEKENPPGKPWDNTKKKAHRRTIQDLRRERRAAGLCAECGDHPPAEGVLTCQSCREYNIMYSRMKREEAKQKAGA